MLNYLLSNRYKVVVLAALATAGVLVYAITGSLKSATQVDWLELLVQGICAAAALLWVLLFRSEQKSGKWNHPVTAGLTLLFMAFWLGSLGATFDTTSTQDWASVIGSLSLLCGILMITLGLWLWRKAPSEKTEVEEKPSSYSRDHLWLDGLKQLGQVDQLEKSLAQSWYHPDEIRVLLMAELEGFPQFERLYGEEEADRLLRESAELLMLNLRSGDLLCRYARGRLVLSLPQTSPAKALNLVAQLRNAVEHFAFREQGTEHVLKQNLIVGVAVRQPGDSPGDLIQRANLAVRMAASGSGQSLAS